MSSKLRVLLTGGAGFIGSHVAEALLHHGASLSIVDNLDSFYSPEIKKANLCEVSRCGKFQFLRTDIRDRGKLSAAFAISRPNVVIHLAALAGVRPSIANPSLYYQVNVEGTLNVLEMCREFHVPTFVFGSSSSVYGAMCDPPFREDNPCCHPISPYAATKLAAELLCFTYAYLYDISAVCLRFFTVYGPRQRPDLAIHKFTALIEQGQPIEMYGVGTSARDYTYISDIVSGIIAALSYRPALSEGARFDAINLGNSNAISLSSLIAMIQDATGRPAFVEQRNWQAGDVPLTLADITKAKTLLGYSPKVTLATGLKEFVNWYRSSRPSVSPELQEPVSIHA